MRRALYLLIIVLSVAVVLYLCLGLRLLRFQNVFISSIVVLAPIIFAMPWVVMLRDRK